MTAESLRVGLTGGIASGKTGVARLLRGHGAWVVDADDLASDLLRPGGAGHDAVIDHFGSRIVLPDETIDRELLAALVFGDENARRALESIMHPAIRDEFARLVAEASPPVAVLEAALLVETGAWRDFDTLVVASCSREAQISRMRRRDGLSLEAAEARLAAQLPLSRKLEVADHVIDTNCPVAETARQVEALWQALCAAAERLRR